MEPQERRITDLIETVTRLDERQRRDREDYLALRHEVTGVSASLGLLSIQLTEIRASLDGRIGKAMWGYAIGAVGMTGGILGLIMAFGGA